MDAIRILELALKTDVPLILLGIGVFFRSSYFALYSVLALIFIPRHNSFSSCVIHVLSWRSGKVPSLLLNLISFQDFDVCFFLLVYVCTFLVFHDALLSSDELNEIYSLITCEMFYSWLRFLSDLFNVHVVYSPK